jgi:hypothetical protein
MAIKDYLKDITTYVTPTAFFDKIKVVATDKEIFTEAIHKDRQVILQGKYLTPIPNFEGEFGLANLSLLQTITNDPEFSYKETTASITYETRNGESVPTELEYENKSKSYINYRFMNKGLLPDLPPYNEPQWEVTIKPTKSNIQQFSWAATGLSQYEQYFIPKIVDGNMKFFIGEDDAATQRGGVVFASDLTETFSSNHKWNVEQMLTVLKITGSSDCEMKFSSKGAIQVMLNTGLSVYKYIFPAKINRQVVGSKD